MSPPIPEDGKLKALDSKTGLNNRDHNFNPCSFEGGGSGGGLFIVTRVCEPHLPDNNQLEA